LGKGWSSTLLPGERPSWSDQSGTLSLTKEEFELPGPDWRWKMPWEIAISHNTDAEGWEYAKDFKKRAFGPKKSYLHNLRRRQWARRCAKIIPEIDDAAPIFPSLSLSKEEPVFPQRYIDNPL